MRGSVAFLPYCMCIVVFACSIFLPYAHAQSPNLSSEERDKLEAHLADLEKEMAKTQATIDSLSQQGASLERDIAILDGEIKKAKLRVQSTELEIQKLSEGIGVRSETIDELSSRIEKNKISLAQTIRETHKVDDYSLAEVVLSAKDFSDFFSDLGAFVSIRKAMHESFEELRTVRAQTEEEKTGLEGERTDKQILQSALELEQKKVEQKEAQKQQLLAETKGQESLYRSLKAAQEQTAAQIRAALFPLRDTEGIPFGTAVEYAKRASAITGVRPAMILAILSQESDLGKNVGQCYITDLETGDGKGKNTGTPFPGTMKVPRDTVPFERIMNALGRDWSTTPVSCPLPGGYGGAMGPTQFIPSTWEMYAGRIESALGVSASDPWNALHAITATGLYLMDGGAAGGNYMAEHTAAAKYYAGGAWATSGQHYANSVMAKASAFQDDIDFLEEN